MREDPLKLYWVTTEDHEEDWFVVATSAREAARKFEGDIGYEKGDALAQQVLEIPPDTPIEPADTDWFEGWPDWPSNDSLIALGASFICQDPARVVTLAGNTYAEGLMDTHLRTLDDDAFESLGRGRPNGTSRSGQPDQ